MTRKYYILNNNTVLPCYTMMTSSNGNIFHVTDHLCGEFTGLRWVPHPKASDAELWCFLWSTPGWVKAGVLRRHQAHYDVIVMPTWNVSLLPLVYFSYDSRYLTRIGSKYDNLLKYYTKYTIFCCALVFNITIDLNRFAHVNEKNNTIHAKISIAWPSLLSWFICIASSLLSERT